MTKTTAMHRHSGARSYHKTALSKLDQELVCENAMKNLLNLSNADIYRHYMELLVYLWSFKFPEIHKNIRL